MKKIKKPILLAIALAIVGLLITSAASMNLPIDTLKDVEKNIVKIGSSPECFSSQHTMAEPDIITRDQLLVLGSWPVFAFEGNQLHPGFGRTGGAQVAAFFDEDWDEILYTYSTDDGQTFNEDMAYWQGYGGDYPSIKHWDGMRFFGTYVTDMDDAGGGDIHMFECKNALNYPYEMWTAPLSENGWYGMIDADIACDNSQNNWEWGMHSLVISTTSGDGYIDGPTVYYSDPDTPNDVWISWYSYDGCAHCDIDIDPVPHGDYRWIYAVYDWLDADNWKLLVREKDFVDVLSDDDDSLYEIEGDGNLKYPVVAAYDDNIVILVETDENVNKDIICYYTDDGNIENLQTSFVVDTGDDERYPDVRHVQDDDFICTYVKNDNLYALMTEDGGQTWIETQMQVNDNDDCVVEEYKTSDLCEKAVYAMWEEDCGDDVDIYMGSTSTSPNDPPGAPTVEGTENGNTGNSYEYTFTAVDPDGDDVSYYIKWGDEGVTDWTAFQTSGTPYFESHIWSEDGTYTIEAKAKDTSGLEGPWGTLTVTMPVNQQQGSHQSSQSSQSSSSSSSSSAALVLQVVQVPHQAVLVVKAVNHIASNP